MSKNGQEESRRGAIDRRSALTALGLASGSFLCAAGGPLTGSPLMAAEADEIKATMTDVSKDSVTDAGEPIIYLNTPRPEISSAIMTIPAGTTTQWMVHPVQGYVYGSKAR